jgi:hypothetical protein
VQEMSRRFRFWHDRRMLAIHRFQSLCVVNGRWSAHVHVLGLGAEAVFVLHCLDGSPQLRVSYGFKRAEPVRIKVELAAVLAELCKE